MVNLASKNSHQKLLPESMETIDTYLQKADNCRKQGEWEEAIKCYRTVLEIKPEDWQPLHHVHLGDCLLNAKRWQEARTAYNQALEGNPNLVWAHHNLGLTLIHLEEFEEAYGCFDKVSSLKPDFWDLPNVKPSAKWQQKLGDYFFEQKRWQEAVVSYQRGIKLNPELAELYLNLGLGLQKLGKFQEALKTLKKAVFNSSYYLDKYPDVKDIQLSPFKHFLKFGLDEGRNPHPLFDTYYFIEKKRHNHKVLETYFCIGHELLQKNQFEEATKLYKHLVIIESENHIVHHMLGDSLAKQKKWEEAIAAYSQATQLNPNFAPTYHNLGEVFKEQGRWEEASNAFHCAVELDQNSPISSLFLGEMLANQGLVNEASDFYYRAIKLGYFD